MRKLCLFLILLLPIGKITLGQVELKAMNKPIDLLNDANNDIENGNYEQAVQKLIASIRLQPKIRDAYLSLNTACSHTNQTAILKSY